MYDKWLPFPFLLGCLARNGLLRDIWCARCIAEWKGSPDSLPHFIRLFLGILRSRLACEIGDLKKPCRARTHNMRCEETQLSRQLPGSRTGRTRQHQQRLARHKNIVAEPGEAAGSRPRATEQRFIAKASVCSASPQDIAPRFVSSNHVQCILMPWIAEP